MLSQFKKYTTQCRIEFFLTLLCLYFFHHHPPFQKDALTVFLAQDTSQTPPAMRMDWEELEEIFGGDRLVMRSNEESEYALCII